MQIGVRKLNSDRGRNCCLSAFLSNVCIQHHIKKMLWVTRPLNVQGWAGGGLHDA